MSSDSTVKTGVKLIHERCLRIVTCIGDNEICDFDKIHSLTETAVEGDLGIGLYNLGAGLTVDNGLCIGSNGHAIIYTKQNVYVILLSCLEDVTVLHFSLIPLSITVNLSPYYPAYIHALGLKVDVIIGILTDNRLGNISYDLGNEVIINSHGIRYDILRYEIVISIVKSIKQTNAVVSCLGKLIEIEGACGSLN